MLEEGWEILLEAWIRHTHAHMGVHVRTHAHTHTQSSFNAEYRRRMALDAAAAWICCSSLSRTQGSRISLFYISSNVTRTANKRHWKSTKNYTWSLFCFVFVSLKFKARLKFYIFRVNIQRSCRYFLSKQQNSVLLNMASRWLGSSSPVWAVKPCWHFWFTQVLPEAVSPFQNCSI